MRRHESQLVLRMWPAATPARRLVREHLLDEEASRRHVEPPENAAREAAEADVHRPGDTPPQPLSTVAE